MKLAFLANTALRYSFHKRPPLPLTVIFGGHSTVYARHTVKDLSESSTTYKEFYFLVPFHVFLDISSFFGLIVSIVPV